MRSKQGSKQASWGALQESQDDDDDNNNNHLQT